MPYALAVLRDPAVLVSDEVKMTHWTGLGSFLRGPCWPSAAVEHPERVVHESARPRPLRAGKLLGIGFE